MEILIHLEPPHVGCYFFNGLVRVLQAPQDYSVCQAMVIADPDGNAVILHQRAEGTCGREKSEDGVA